MTAARSASLVSAAKHGDRDAFAELHRRYVRLVRGLLVARFGTRDLDDRVQDVFTIALERLHQLRDGEAFGSWIAQIARRGGPGRREPLADDVLVDALPATEAPRAEAERLLVKIRSLPAALAEPLVLRLVFGMTGPEIARELDLSPRYVRVALHRGMARLRAVLAVAACLIAVAVALATLAHDASSSAPEVRADPSDVVAPSVPPAAPAQSTKPAPLPRVRPAEPKAPFERVPAKPKTKPGKILDPFANKPAK